MKSNRDKCDLLLGSSKPDKKKKIEIHKLVIPSAVVTLLNIKLNNYSVKKQFFIQ